MYKVVIIDDEPVIVEGLTKIIEWSKWNCSVAGTAYDGTEGLSLIREIKPDILITDISMPNMDGLTMIAALKSEMPLLQISILTGYRDFDYAQTAIRLGVCRFLLKPSKIDEIEEALTIMTERLERIRKRMEKSGELDASENSKENDLSASEIGESSTEEAVANSFVVRNALKYMNEHYSDKLRLSDVADRVYVSQWHLSKLLNRDTGSNFSELLNGIRVDKAKELLSDPSLRICDIAEMVGFTDLTHFSRVFKKLEGISANEYRNKN